MNIDARVENLTAQHTDIDRKLDSEQHRPNPDTMRLMQLKKEKLRLKEEIRRFRSH